MSGDQLFVVAASCSWPQTPAVIQDGKAQEGRNLCHVSQHSGDSSMATCFICMKMPWGELISIIPLQAAVPQSDQPQERMMLLPTGEAGDKLQAPNAIEEKAGRAADHHQQQNISSSHPCPFSPSSPWLQTRGG